MGLCDIMDFIAHIFWSYIFFHKEVYWYLAIFFGILPDLALTGQFFSFIFRRKKINWKYKNSVAKNTPDYVFKLYNFSHSLITFSVCFALVYAIIGTDSLFMIAWFLHILFDIPTHEKGFFDTKFLYPISDYSIDGYRWSNKYFMIANYSFIIACFVMVFFSII